MHVIMCGGRTYRFSAWDKAWLRAAHARRPFLVVLHGDAPGADAAAAAWACSQCIRTCCYRADWAMLGARAGPVRNQAMLDALLAYPLPHAVIVFPGDGETADTIQRATAAAVPLWFPHAPEARR